MHEDFENHGPFATGMRPPVPPRVMFPGTHVYTLHKAGTVFGVHPSAPITYTTSTCIAVFLEERHARVWQRGLNTYIATEGRAPDRAYSRPPKRFQWQEYARFPSEAPEIVTVHKTTFEEVQQRLDGTNIKCRVYLDPYDSTRAFDVRQRFLQDRTLARLESCLDRSVP